MVVRTKAHVHLARPPVVDVGDEAAFGAGLDEGRRGAAVPDRHHAPDEVVCLRDGCGLLLRLGLRVAVGWHGLLILRLVLRLRIGLSFRLGRVLLRSIGRRRGTYLFAGLVALPPARPLVALLVPLRDGGLGGGRLAGRQAGDRGRPRQRQHGLRRDLLGDLAHGRPGDQGCCCGSQHPHADEDTSSWHTPSMAALPAPGRYGSGVAVVAFLEDDPRIRQAVVRALTELGHAVRSFDAGMPALESVVADPPDVVLLDLGLPDIDGGQWLQLLRAVSSVPVIAATARDADEDIIRTLDLGADDYVVKPFSAAQIDARIRAVLRRAGGPDAEPEITVGGLHIDLRGRRVVLDGNELSLTRKEFDVLAYLAGRAGEVVTKREMLADLWQQPWGGADKTIDVHLSWLRRKLGETAADPQYLHTVRGVGVKLAAPER